MIARPAASAWALLAVAALAAGTLARSAEEPPLKSLMPRGVLTGVAVNPSHTSGKNAVEQAIVLRHFNSITNENALKWEQVHPEPDRYDFGAADEFVAFGEKHGMFIVGHVLVWHQQTPDWVFTGADGRPAGREELLERMRSHIHTVVGRYRGRVHAWDVVNEALNEDGTLRRTPWRDIIGDDYIAKAFQFAHEADPEAELYYNDYNLPKAEKGAGALGIVRALKARGLRIDGIGEQGHWLMDFPSVEQIDAMLREFGAAGFKTHITELDIDVLPRDPAMYGADLDAKQKFRAETNIYPDGLPDERQQALARRYADVFSVLMRHRETLARVTFWGVTDGHSWLNNFPVPGRVNYPLLWDREGRPKPAFHAVVKVLQSGGRVSE